MTQHATPLTADVVANPSLIRLYIRISGCRLDLLLYNPFEDNSIIHRSFSLSEADNEGLDRRHALENIIYDNPLLLNGNFHSVTVLLDTPLVAIVPQEVAESVDRLAALTYPQAVDSHTLISQEVDSLGVIVAAYADSDILKFLRRTFADARISHPLIPMMAYCRSKCSGAALRTYIDIDSQSLRIVTLSATRLYTATTFSCDNPDDAAFYTLSTLSILPSSPDEIMVSGENALRSALTDRLRQFHPYVMPTIFPSEMHKSGARSGQMPIDLLVAPLTE